MEIFYSLQQLNPALQPKYIPRPCRIENCSVTHRKYHKESDYCPCYQETKKNLAGLCIGRKRYCRDHNGKHKRGQIVVEKHHASDEYKGKQIGKIGAAEEESSKRA